MADIRLSDVNSFLSEVKDRHHVSRRDHERATQRLRCQLKLIQRRRALSHALDLLQKQPAGHQLGGEWNIEQTSLASTSCQEDPLHNAISALQEAMGVLDYGVTTSDRMYQIAHHVQETLQLGPSMASKHSMHHESVQKTSNQTSCSAVCWVGPRQRHQDVSHKITVSQAYDVNDGMEPFSADPNSVITVSMSGFPVGYITGSL